MKEIDNNFLITLRIRLNPYKEYKKGKPHILFVEGETDKKFYEDLFAISKFNEPSIGKISFTTDKGRINIIEAKKLITNNASEKGNIYNKSKTKRELAWETVIKAIKYYEENIENFYYVDCFGLIDNDFGHEESINLNNISITRFHDRETSLLRCYLVDYFKEIDGMYKNKALEVLEKSLDFTIRQGILEKMSWKYEKEHPEDFKFEQIRFTHSKFDDCSRNSYLDFDFDEYFENEYKGKFDEIKNMYRTTIDSEYNFYFDLANILRRWLIDKKSTNEDDNNLDMMFRYTNGHYIISQLILNGKRFFSTNSNVLNDEKEFVKCLTNISKKKFEKLFNELPLIKYKKYRIENKIYSPL